MGLDDSLIGFVAEIAERRAATGELRLVAAVLEAAIHDVKRGDSDAIAWLASDEEAASVQGWSYVGLCAHLRVDPGWLRAVIADEVAARPYTLRQSRLDAGQVDAA